MSAASASLRVSEWQRLTWPHPEWWSLALCVGGWLLIFRNTIGANGHAPEGHFHHAMATAPPMNAGWAWSAPAFWWLVMVVAMMFPLLLDPIRNVAARSLWSRRHRAIALFLTGYLGPWLAFGVAVAAALFALDQISLKPQIATSIGFGAALIWQMTPVKRRSVLACHRTRPIAPFGWRANRDCLRYGWLVGSSCLISCWALMFACMLSRHSLPAMFAATAIGWFERNRPRRNQRLACAVIALLGLIYAMEPYLQIQMH